MEQGLGISTEEELPSTLPSGPGSGLLLLQEDHLPVQERKGPPFGLLGPRKRGSVGLGTTQVGGEIWAVGQVIPGLTAGLATL